MTSKELTGKEQILHPGITRRNLLLFILLLALPNLLGMINIPTVFGSKFHFFQAGIIFAALAFGPLGGAAAGAAGSVYSAIMLSNPYIVLGNIILGFFTGLFIRRGLPVLAAVLQAFVIQLIWLWPSDVYLMEMPVPAVNGIVVGLLLSNSIWALAIQAGKILLDRRGSTGEGA